MSSIRNIDELIFHLNNMISENITLKKKKVQVENWMVELKYSYDNYHDKWTDGEEIFLPVVRIYQILRLEIGEEKTITMDIFTRYLRESIFKYESFTGRDIDIITSFIIDSFSECESDGDDDDADDDAAA